MGQKIVLILSPIMNSILKTPMDKKVNNREQKTSTLHQRGKYFPNRKQGTLSRWYQE